jgi:hypothetical protein
MAVDQLGHHFCIENEGYLLTIVSDLLRIYKLYLKNVLFNVL